MSRLQHLSDRVLFGAAYYHEYHPADRAPRIATDLDLMKEAGFSVIRVGESVWSTWEPEDGVFDLDWLQPVLDAAHERGIGVVLGTPTYALPMWLARRYPELNVERQTGQRAGWGARQEIDYSHPAFLFHAERVIRAVVGRYADHPAIIGFQVDNEPGAEIFHNHQVFQRFVDHLRRQYGSVEEINEQWGLTYWSHRLSDWADLWTPDNNAQPQYALAWRRFQASLTTEYIGWQTEIVRGYARADQFVTTCIAYDRPTADEVALAAPFDITAGNAYYRMQDHLALPSSDAEQSWMTAGLWSVYQTADRMYGTKQGSFLVTETNAWNIGYPWMHEPAYDGQWRQVAWALISRGAQMIEYWHWHTLPYGTETYWGGVLPHSLEPGRVYREIAALGGEIAAAGERVVGLVPDAQVGIVFSNPSKWAAAEFPALGGASGPARRSFQEIVDAFYRGAFEAGLAARVLHLSQLLPRDPAEVVAELPTLVAAGLAILDDDELGWLRRYAEAGGHLIVGIRTGYEDHEARARLDRKPAVLGEIAGVWYEEFSTLRAPLPVQGSGTMPVPAAAAGTSWVDGLQVDGAEVLVSYEHPHFGRWPAVTTRAVHGGRVTYVGTVPNPALAEAIMAWVGEQHGADAVWAAQSASQTVRGATNAAGERLRFIHSWGWEPTSYLTPVPAVDVLTGEALAAGTTLELGPWDVRVLLES